MTGQAVQLHLICSVVEVVEVCVNSSKNFVTQPCYSYGAMVLFHLPECVFYCCHVRCISWW